MKKILLFCATLALAQNIYLVSPIKSNANTSFVTFEDKANKILTYVQTLKTINLEKIKPTFENAKKDLCSKKEIRKSLQNGYMIEFIYLGSKNSVVMRFTDCK